MRILHVVDMVTSDGGVGVHVAQLCEALARAGHAVHTLRLLERGQAAATADAPCTLMPRNYGFVRGLRLRRRLADVLRESAPDVIHVHESFGTLSPVLLAQMRAAAPVVGTLHDTRPFCYLMTRRFGPTGAICDRHCGAGCFASGCVRPRGAADAIRWARRWAVDGRSLDQWRRLERVIVPSAYLRDLAVQHGIPASRVRIVRHGTAIPDSTPACRDEPPLIAYVGNLLRYKGVHVMIQALERLRTAPWQATIVGKGPELATLGQAVERAGLAGRVRLAGYVGDRGAIQALLGRARMLVVPSIVPESFGMAGIEALAAGTPVVSFGLGGIAEWLRPGETGLVAADSDPADLARAMEVLLRDAGLAGRMGLQGRDLVAREFDPQHALRGVLAAYDEAQASS